MKLLEPIQLGTLTLKNRMVMSTMTRSCADVNGVVGDITAQYYKQRAGAGLIFTEAIRISEQATGSPFTPGIYTKEQIERFERDAVLNQPDRATMFGGGTQGYIDYPFLND